MCGPGGKDKATTKTKETLSTVPVPSEDSKESLIPHMYKGLLSSTLLVILSFKSSRTSKRDCISNEIHKFF
jgi:hypothetical protein